MNSIHIPNEAVKYILFQRTGYLRLTRTLAYRLINRLSPFAVYPLAVALEAKLMGGRVKEQYRRDMLNEYADIRGSLPQKCSSILDIGCGVAGIDVLLARHYGEPVPLLHLLDKSRVEGRVFYHFKERGAFYNSLDVAKSLLLSNGIPADRLRMMEARDDNAIPATAGIDLVVSLISWGFHYPLDTYLDAVHALMSDGGSLIVDVRDGTGGVEKLGERFSSVTTVSRHDKFTRVLALK